MTDRQTPKLFSKTGMTWLMNDIGTLFTLAAVLLFWGMMAFALIGTPMIMVYLWWIGA